MIRLAGRGPACCAGITDVSNNTQFRPFSSLMSPPAPHGEVPGSAQEAVLCTSEPLPSSTAVVRGYDFPPWPPTGAAPPAVDYERLLEAMATTGFQATAFGEAVEEIKRMLAWRLSDALPEQAGEDAAEFQLRQNTRCKVRAASRCAASCPLASARALRASSHTAVPVCTPLRSFWAAPATWCPVACGKASGTWCSTA